MSKTERPNVVISLLPSGGGVSVSLPLTHPTGKVRVKSRSSSYGYGVPVATRKKDAKLTQDSYVEWQIGYDLLANAENAGRTSLSDNPFINYKGERKYAYELAEIIHYALSLGLVQRKDILDCKQMVEAISDESTFEETVSIKPSQPVSKHINGMQFYQMEMQYPLFVHRFEGSEISVEIVVQEKQRAVGTQAMLYLCLPLSSLSFVKSPFGRNLDAKERGIWKIGPEEAALLLKLLAVFGTLSPKHRFDVMKILEILSK